MDEEIRNMLDEAIKSEISDLYNLSPGSKEKSEAIDDLVKLYKLRIEETRTELDYDEKYEKRIMENDQHALDVSLKEKQMQNDAENHEREEQLKKDQLADQVKDRYFRLGVEAAGIVLPLIFYAVWMKKGFKFEETGIYTSTTFRGLFNRFRPTK